MKCVDMTTDCVIALASDGVLSRNDSRAAKARMRSIIQQVREGSSAMEVLHQLGPRHDNATLITIRFSEGG